MSERITCLKCGTPFYTSYSLFGQYTCNICMQTEAIERQTELSRRQQQESEQNRLILARESNQYDYNEMAQASQRVADSLARTQKALVNYVESSITDQHAFDTGYNYLDKYFNVADSDNKINFYLYIREDGSPYATWTHLYESARLQNQFKNGVSQRLSKIPNADINLLLAQAKLAGEENVLGKLPSKFSLHTGVYVNNLEVPTLTFNSNMKEIVNENNGTVSYTWNHPFSTDSMNNAFSEGANQGMALQNSSENTTLRLNNILYNKKITKQKNSKKRIVNILCKTHWLFPVVCFYIINLFGVGLLVTSVITLVTWWLYCLKLDSLKHKLLFD